jgi:hypothetical protein
MWRTTWLGWAASQPSRRFLPLWLTGRLLRLLGPLFRPPWMMGWFLQPLGRLLLEWLRPRMGRPGWEHLNLPRMR